MPPFVYQQYQSPYANTIAQLLAHQGDPAAQAAQTIAAAQARAGEIGAQAWGGAIQNIANAGAGAVQEIAREQEIAPRLGAEKIQLQNLQDKQRGQQALNTALAGDTLPADATGPRMPSFMTADGRYDVPALTEWLNGRGLGAQAPDLVAHAESLNDALDKSQAAQEAAAAKRAVYLGGVAQGALKLNQQIGMPLDGAVQFLSQQGLIGKQFTQAQLDGVLQQMRQLPPEQQQAYLQRYVAAADQAQQPLTVKEGETVIGRTSGTPLYTAPQKKDPAWLAADAATVDTADETPTARQSAIAISLLKPKPKEPARSPEQDDQQYRQIVADLKLGKPVSDEMKAWASGYEKQKTLGPALTADAALGRLTDTLGHQDKELAARELFQRQEVGRKELSDKVDTEYYTRTGAAETMRRTIREAQGGNVTAAALQNLETTMAAIRAQQLNRINTSEIHATADAGSLWNNLEAWVGKKAVGQPVPPEIQKGMLEFADMLTQQAEYTYLQKFNTAKKRYQLGDDEQPLVKPKKYNPATGKVE